MADGSLVGKLQAAFAQASHELTFTAANLNFDFCLVKYEAPAEYQPLGKALSASRVRDAESGPLHTTALFEGVCPETPNLIKAYGTRVSEISREVLENDSRSTQGSNWIRTEYGGIDATSIWAAATSSKAALPIHLLACILARMWKHTEATSLWAEIVSERKKEIRAKLEQGECVSVALASAALQEITRDHLAKWDASARSWLQTADLARQREYKQFLLVIQNISIAIHQENMALYPNVIFVWTSALQAMEGLVSGRPHVVRDGSVIIGLSAWHIYPDMVIFDQNSCNKQVLMKDILVAGGGILSLGISDAGRQEDRGVNWSLSLAHHKFYGAAVKQTRRLDVDGSRLIFSELMLVCLGSLLRTWSISPEETQTALKILLAIVHVFPKSGILFQAEKKDKDGDGEKKEVCEFKEIREKLEAEVEFNEGWRTVLGEPILDFFRDEKQAILAVSLGRRRPNFLPRGVAKATRPFFNTTNLQCLMFVLKGVDEKIELLRRISKRLPGLNKDNSIILCYNDSCPVSSKYTFATAFPENYSDKDGSIPLNKRKGPRHRRWVSQPCFPQKGLISDTLNAECKEDSDPYTERLCQDHLEDIQLNERVNYIDPMKEGWSYDPHFGTVISFDAPNDTYENLIGQHYLKGDEYKRFGEHAGVYTNNKEILETGGIRWHSTESAFTLEDVLWCFQSGFIDPVRLKFFLASDAAFSFLKVMWAVSKIYHEPSAGGATISGTIVNSTFAPPIFSMELAPDDWVSAHTHLVFSQDAAISLIGYFETGYNIVENMKGTYNIIGLSGGDSIFVLTALLSDPEHECPDYSFTRILGSTGIAGFSILSSPAVLMSRNIDPGAWRVVPNKFDGKPADFFDTTSLHLGFTDWFAPVVRIQGQRDAEANIIEAVVSIRDSGKWVADVDIFQALRNRRIYRPRKNCNHSAASKADAVQNMQSVESWDQVLDCPDGPVVIRSHKNWIARLSIVSALCQHSSDQERHIAICSHDMCWQCQQQARPASIYIY